MDGVRADYMGMLGIVMNCLALQEFLEQRGVVTRVQTAITMGQIAEPYIPLRAIRHLEKGRVVIFGAGMGLPFFTTDTVAVQRPWRPTARRSSSPRTASTGSTPPIRSSTRRPPGSTRSPTRRRSAGSCKVVDQTAFTLAAENKLPMIVMGLEPEGNILRAAQGEKIGTLVSAG